MIYNIKKTNLQEMPHIQTNGDFYDLELELHQQDSEREFIEYVKDVLDMANSKEELKKALLSNEPFVLWITNKFGKNVLSKIKSY